MRFGQLEPMDSVYLDCDPGGQVLLCPGTPVSTLFDLPVLRVCLWQAALPASTVVLCSSVPARC